MPKSTLQLPDTTGMTFEKVWATIQRQSEEHDRMIEENRKRSEENQKMIEENRKENQKMIEENRKENQKMIAELNKKFGDMTSRFGEMVEHLVAPGIAERFNALGYHFDAVMPGGIELKDEKGSPLAQIDLMLENSETAMAVEIKAKPSISEIKKFAEKTMKIIRRYRETHHHPDVPLLGAIAGAIFPQNAKKFAIDSGFYVIVQTGDTVQIEVPKNFKPTRF